MVYNEIMVINENNIHAIMAQMLAFSRRERMQPAEHVRPCGKCGRYMANQAECVIITKGVPLFLCKECADDSSIKGW